MIRYCTINIYVVKYCIQINYVVGSLAGQPLLMQRAKYGLVNEVTSACPRGMYSILTYSTGFTCYIMTIIIFVIFLARDYQQSLSSANRRWEIAAPPCFCLACGKDTQPNARSLLCSKASSNVCQVSNELLAQRKTSWSQCSFYNGRWLRLQEMLCLWKPYKIQLLLNLDAAIGSMPSSAITFVSDLTTRQSRNDFIPERPAKHQRLNLTSSSSGS